MSDSPPFVSTKLYIPAARGGRVARPRLTAQLDQGVGGSLTLLCAPAGFGKTTLLAEWCQCRLAEGSPLQVAWLSLETEDNDPVRFLAYLAAALDRARPGTTQAVQGLLNAPRPGLLAPRQIVVHLAAALAVDRAPADAAQVALVLDDYQTITSLEIHDTVAYLLDHLPTYLHVVLGTRADPPLPLGRLRARGQLTEIRAAELRFSPEETKRFINDLMGLGLEPDEVASLATRTEGWAAGLQLAGLALRAILNHPDNSHGSAAQSLPTSRSSFVAAFAGSHHYIVDYLAEEVIAGQTAQVRDFLLRTCLLRRLCAPLCDTLAEGAANGRQADGRMSSQAVLEHLEQHNLFLVPLDAERRWYRYHPLFAEALQAVARHAPEVVADTHRRAAGWFAANGVMTEAVWHALAAGDFTSAAEAVERSYPQLVQSGELATIRGWLAALPAEVIAQRPRLGLAWAWAHAYTSSPPAFERQLDQVDAALAGMPALECRPLRGELAVLRGVYASVYWRAADALRLAQEALELLPSGDRRLRAVALQALGNAHRLRGEVAAAEQAYREVIAYSQSDLGTLFGMLAATRLGQVQLLEGRLHDAAETLQAVVDQAQRLGGELAAFGAEASIYLAEVHYERDALNQARVLVDHGLSLTQHALHAQTALPAHLLLARLHAIGGDLATARVAIDRAKQLVIERHFPPIAAALVNARAAELALVAGDLEAASEWASGRGDSKYRAGRDEGSLTRDFETLILARIRLAEGRPADALRHLTTAQQAAEKQGRWSTVTACLTLAALARHGQREGCKAVAALCQALAQAEPEGYVRLFTEAGAPMADLLARVHGPCQAYAQLLLARMAPAPRPAAGTGRLPAQARTAGAALVEPLSARELEVLQWLAGGASNRAIAEALVISVGTVKTHISRIMGKLGARNRTEAVARARQSGLLA